MQKAVRKTVNRSSTSVFPVTRTPDPPGVHKSQKQHVSFSVTAPSGGDHYKRLTTVRVDANTGKIKAVNREQ